MSNPSRDFIDLDHVDVASPCPARWEDMAGSEQVRHCELCQLNVYNLSAMSREEAAGLVLEREGRLCVRFFRRPDGTLLTADCPRGARAAARWVIARTAVAIAFLAAATLTLFPFVRRTLAGTPLENLRRIEPIRSSIEIATPPVAPLMGDICVAPPAVAPVPAPASAAGSTSGEPSTGPAPASNGAKR